jgi:hypothetical protein
LGYFIGIASSAFALFHSHHCIYSIHFYKIWSDLDNTVFLIALYTPAVFKDLCYVAMLGKAVCEI